MISLSLMFVGWFAYRFEFDQSVPKSRAEFYYILVSVLTLILFGLNLAENYVTS